MMNKLGHVFLVDDDASIRNSISRVLREAGYDVEAHSSASDFMEKSTPVFPAVILLDMQMLSMTGLQLQEKLLRMGRGTPIVFISGHSQPQEIVDALKKGAHDFLLKPFSMKTLLGAVSNAIAFDLQQSTEINQHADAKRRYSSLTAREQEVCDLLIKGLMNKDISQVLGITDATVKVHKAHIMEKMQLDSVPELVRISIEAKLC